MNYYLRCTFASDLNSQQNCILEDLGMVGYRQAWDYQLQLFHHTIEQKQQNQLPTHHLLLVQHNHVYTFGKSAKENNLLATPQQLAALGAEVFHIERGGDITYHGPGQLVAYPIFDLEQLQLGVKAYVEGIEQCIINVIAEFGITGKIIPNQIGVWIDAGGKNERKIAAIGIKCSRFVSMHGLALNVSTDLQMFKNIVPCGIPDKDVTSIEKETNRKIDMNNVKNSLGKQFASIFGINLI